MIPDSNKITVAPFPEEIWLDVVKKDLIFGNLGKINRYVTIFVDAFLYTVPLTILANKPCSQSIDGTVKIFLKYLI